MRSGLPQAIQNSLHSVFTNGWSEYLSLCARYNIEPSEFIIYMNNIYKYDIKSRNPRIVINNEHKKTYDLTRFAKIQFTELQSLEINRYRRKFSLNGICAMSMPSLYSIVLGMRDMDIGELEYFRTNSLNSLHLHGSYKSVPKIEIPCLKIFRLFSLKGIDITFLNESILTNLEHLSISNPIQNYKDIGEFSKIDMSRLPNLSSLSLIEERPFVKIGKTRITGESIPKQLKEIKLHNIMLDMSHRITLPNLTHLTITIDTLDLFQYLDLPNLIFLNIRGKNLVFGPKNEDEIAHNIGNLSARISYGRI